MNSSLRRTGLFTLLCIAAACSAPDTKLFSENVPVGARPGDGDVEPGAGTAAMGGAVNPAGGSSGNSGSGGAAAPAAGSPATAGSSASGTGGTAVEPDPGGGAGGSEGGAGEPTPMTGPVCGNGVIEEGEQCDDAGHTGQDGCDSDCAVQCSQHGAGTIESGDHHCYAGYEGRAFEAARQDCTSRGGHLATITSADENTMVQMLVNNSKWTGGFEDVPITSPGKGDYAWVTGEAFGYENWAQDEPNADEYRCPQLSLDPRCYEHCIAILGDGTWADRRCDMADGYVCEWDPPSAK